MFGPPAWRCSRLFPPCRWSVSDDLRTSYWGCFTAAVRVLLHGGFAEGVGYQVAVGLLSASYFSSVGVVPPRRMGELRQACALVTV